MSWVKGYNHEKYWHRRSIVVDPKNKTPLLIKLYYLWYIKRKDAKFGCSFGTNLNSGSYFETPPYLPHGPYGSSIWYIFNDNGVCSDMDIVANCYSFIYL